MQIETWSIYTVYIGVLTHTQKGTYTNLQKVYTAYVSSPNEIKPAAVCAT